jgi:hypothetical protein
MLRRIAVLAGLALLVFAGVAWAVTDTVSYTATIKKAGGGSKPTAKKPVNISYTGTLHIDTDPTGQQPDVGPITTVYFAKGIKENAVHFPSCTVTDIDGKSTFPAKCNKAVVGTGTSTAYAGSPGGDKTQSIKEDLTVKAVNGNKGKQILLVVNSTPSAPVAITNRVVPGDLGAGSGPYGYTVKFTIPADLQEPVPGVKVALTDFVVTIRPSVKAWKQHGKTVKGSYLQLTSCAGSMPVQAITQFKDDAGNLTPVTATSTSKC